MQHKVKIKIELPESIQKHYGGKKSISSTFTTKTQKAANEKIGEVLSSVGAS